jgi:hypothetical protein
VRIVRALIALWLVPSVALVQVLAIAHKHDADGGTATAHQHVQSHHRAAAHHDGAAFDHDEEAGRVIWFVNGVVPTTGVLVADGLFVSGRAHGIDPSPGPALKHLQKNAASAHGPPKVASLHRGPPPILT